MAGEVSIPVWALLLAWALVGLLIGSPWINEKSGRMVLLESTTADRLQLALGIVASGPIVWGAVVAAFIADVAASLRRKFRKGSSDAKG
jgi:uncharacterized membrane protein YczE